MDKPTKCTIPRTFAEVYRLTPADWEHLKAIVREAISTLDFYHAMPQNVTGILATDAPDRRRSCFP